MNEGRWTRRQVLAGGMGGAAAALLGACGRATVTKASSVPPAGSDLGAIEHVVFVMLENRSFDHYFGAYKGVRGFDDHGSDLGAFSQVWPSSLGATHPSQLLPFHLDTKSTNAECTFDLSHEWGVQHQCWDQGNNDRFVAVHTDPQNEGPANGYLTMGYYERSDLDFHYALADAFTVCDAYHCSVFGPTHPNRLYWVSGTLGPDGRRGGPVIVNHDATSAQFSLSWPTMPEVLETHGISWKTYNAAGAIFQPNSGFDMAVSNNMLLYFSQYRDQSSVLYQKAFSPIFPGDFTKDVEAGTLPQVSWIMPGIGQAEHPPSPPEVGMQFTHQLLSILVSNPRVWEKTVLFISFDENDGLFDHVPPPTPPPGTPGEFLSVDPLPSDAKGIAGPIGLGFRVPMLVVSPFSRGGYVCSDVFDHTSQLRFLEARFGVEAPNVSKWRRETTGDLTSSLHMGFSETAIPALPPTPGKSDPSVISECQSEQLSEIDMSNPVPYPLPAQQQMPTQEPGAAKRVR